MNSEGSKAIAHYLNSRAGWLLYVGVIETGSTSCQEAYTLSIVLEQCSLTDFQMDARPSELGTQAVRKE